MPYDHASDPRNQAIGTPCTAASEDDDARLGPRSRRSQHHQRLFPRSFIVIRGTWRTYAIFGYQMQLSLSGQWLPSARRKCAFSANCHGTQTTEEFIQLRMCGVRY
ncbi:hypothetical protein VTO73DRAFT_9124 [Trametes versicolor]